jgi:hypothetical protein
MNEPTPPPVSHPPPLPRESNPFVVSPRAIQPRTSLTKPHHVVKYLMVGSTVLWIASMLFIFMAFQFILSEREHDDYIRYGDRYFHRETSQETTAGAIMVSNFFASVCSGICFPTIPYAIAMIALSVAYFACKPEKTI